MGLTFKRAPYVAAGEAATSAQLAALAKAWNDRLRAGFDCAWRLAAYWFNAFRLVRMPGDGGFVFPPQAEFFEVHQHLEPETGLVWPLAPPGDPEGANPASTLMQYVFGAGASSPGEAVALEALPLYVDGHPPETLEEVWRLGKMQRGGVDPDTGAQNWPAGEAAQNGFRVTSGVYSPHGKSYGAWFPMPEEGPTDCGLWDDTGDASGLASYLIQFSALRDDVEVPPHHGTLTTVDGRSVVTYAGSCPCGTANHAAGHVLGVAALPFAYYVYVGTGDGLCGYNVDRFPVKDWLEGPYTGEGRLRRADGGHVARAQWAFCVDFRGTPTQRNGHGILGQMGLPGAGDDGFNIQSMAFPWQEFMARQYALAPARGVQVGEDLVVNYPAVFFGGLAQPAGALGRFADGRQQHDFHADFVAAGAFVTASGLAAAARVQILSGELVLATLVLTPGADGTGSALEWFEDAQRPDPLRIRLPDGARFSSSSGRISVEVAELLAYRPEAWDGYLICRLGATSGGFGAITAGVDGRGVDQEDAPGSGEALLETGTLQNSWGAAGARAQASWVTDNPIYDAARRLSRDHMRILSRRQLVAYEVTGGKSVLYFKRFANGLHNARADVFHGIAPPLDPVASGLLEVGEVYVVHSPGGAGWITYAGSRVSNGGTFTAGTAREYVATGDAAVYVHNGIRPAARPNGWTNEWIGFLETKCAHPSATSIWKPGAYADFFTFCQRCLFYGGNVPDAAFRRHVSYSYSTELTPEYFPSLLPMRVQANLVAPEAPTGYRYGASSNQSYGGADFRKSCQIYEKPFEVESCTVHDWSPDQVVKVILTTRLRAHPTAPASVNADPTSWSAGERSALTAEAYRTPDNALREYLLHLADGTYFCSMKEGDTGAASGLPGSPDAPYGSCYPTFFLVRLMQSPFEDGNETVEAHDSRCLVDQLLHAEVLTRACCESWVDGRTSVDVICANPLYSGGLYDYSFESLCFEAFGGRSIGAMPMAIRPDGPAGHGPLPNTERHAEVFNRLAAAVNLLDKARIDLPVQIDITTRDWTGTRPESPGPGICAGTGQWGAWADQRPPGPAETLGSAVAGDGSTGFAAAYTSTLGGCPFELVSRREEVEWKLAVQSAFLDAVPDELQELLESGGSGVVAKLTWTLVDWKRTAAAGSGDSEHCGNLAGCNPFTDGANWFKWVSGPGSATWEECKLMSAGTLIPPPPPTSDFYIGHCAGTGGSFCTNAASGIVELTPLNSLLPFVQVPLVD